MTRRTLLEQLDEAGYGKEELSTLQKLIDAEKSDLFDVLEYVFNSDVKPMTREARVAAAQANIFAFLNAQQKELALNGFRGVTQVFGTLLNLKVTIPR